MRRETFEQILNRSSFGRPAVRSLASRTPHDLVRAIRHDVEAAITRNFSDHPTPIALQADPSPAQAEKGTDGARPEETAMLTRKIEPRAFVSFDFDHNELQKNLFVGQAKKDSPTPFTVHDWSSKTKLPQAEWEKLIKQKMASTNMCIVLAGRSMATATGVAKEIKMAKDLGVPVFGVYVDRAGPTNTLPAGLLRNRTIAWEWKAIAAAVKQMMGEGKNLAKK